MKSARAILEARARALAAPLAADVEARPADALPILQFAVGDEVMAVAVSSVLALVHVATITPLPRATDPVLGVMAWRGRPLAVLTVGARASSGKPNRVVVLGQGMRAAAGLLVDELDDIRVVMRDSLSAPPASRAGRSLGITADAVLVLDADALILAARSEP